MGFLNPLILLISLAALIPLLIHLFNRRRIKKLDFSSILFLKSLEKVRLRRLKLRQLILLIIRTLVILFVVFAFARPSLKGSLSSVIGSGTKTSAVILLDNSYSMGYENPRGQLFDIARKKAKSVLDLFSEGDEVYLIIFNSEPLVLTPQPSSRFDDLKQLISEAELSYGSTHLFKALSTAYGFLSESKNLNKEIYLLTDLDRGGWLNQEMSLPEHKNNKLFLIQMEQKERNSAIESLDFGTSLIKKNVPFKLNAKVFNYSPETLDNLLVGFYLDGKRVAQTDIKVEGNSEKEVNFFKTVELAGMHYGHLELSDDELLADNQRHFVFEIPEDIDVLLVGREKDTYYVNLALVPREEEISSINVTSADVNSLSKEDLSEYDAILFSNVSLLNSAQVLDLERYIKEGGGVFFSLGEGVDLKFYSEHIMKKFFNSTIKAPVMGLDRKGFFSWQDLDTEHPIFQPYKDVKKDKFPQVRFFYFFEGTQPSGSKILANFTHLTPALVERSLGKGKIIMFLGSFDPQDSDITRHTIFVPFIHRMTEYLATDISGWENDYPVGSQIRRELSSSFAGKRIKLIDPQNKETELLPFFSDNRLWLKIPESFLPGIYQVESEGKVIDRFAVNVDPFESNPDRIKPQELKEILKGQDIRYVGQDEEIKQKVKEARYGKEIGKSFLWAALILVVMEMLIARTKSREMITE
ncbi:MAG: BatA domain-containing protein [Candidatus Zixiibacteriota bacterium]